MNKNLQDLENAIYNSIPRLRELSIGCEVTFKGEKYPMFMISESNDFLRFIDKNGMTYSWSRTQTESLFNIIGHPILLNDVLEWLRDFVYKPTNFSKIGDLKRMYSQLLDIWDLSSPCLSNQPKIIIDFLFNLIPQE